MTISFGSGQTSGAPLLLTAVTLGTAQTVHTFPAGSATPNLCDLFVTNASDVGVSLTLALYDAIGPTLVWTQTIVAAARAQMQPVFDMGDVEAQLVCNGTLVLKAYASAASVLSLNAVIDNQSATSGTVCAALYSGLIAAVQAANRFACPSGVGGVGTATELNANVLIPRAGILRNLKAVASAAVGGGATLTVAVRINGVSSALSVPIANAQGTTLQSNTASVTVAVGDLVTFLVTCDNAGAPAANVQASCEYVAQ